MAFVAFCIVEIMGHQVIAGKVSEETHFGAPLMRVDVPKSSKREGFTCYYGGGAIYKITPTTEDVVQAFVEKQDPEPIKPYMLALPTMAARVESVADELDDWGDYSDDDDEGPNDAFPYDDSDDYDDPPDDDVIMTGLEQAAEAEQKNNDQPDGTS